jgi:protocatechuate 3,4-dioxygenase beta subunit
MNKDKACQNLREDTAALVLGELEATAAEKLRRHIESCQGCRGLYESMVNEEHLIRSTFNDIATGGKRVEQNILGRLVDGTPSEETGRVILWPKWTNSKAFKSVLAVAAAAVLVAATLIVINMLTADRQDVEGPVPIANDRKLPLDDNMPIRPQLQLEQELRLIEQMFADGDVAGLIGMLQNGQPDSKIAAAKCLGQIGDLRAVEALKACADQWTGAKEDNPFAKAIAQINSRTTKTEPREQPASGKEKPSTQQGRVGQGAAVEGPAEPQYVLCGHITDAATGKPVTDAKVGIHISRVYYASTDANGFYHFENVDKEGNYWVRIASTDYIGVRDDMPVVNLKMGVQTVMDFQLQRACQIEVEVVDEQGMPIKKARLTVSSLADEFGREVSDSARPQETDANGLKLLGGFKPLDQAYLITATHEIEGPVIEKNGRRYVQTRWDYAAGHLIVTLKDPTVIETGQIVLRKGVEVKGYCEYADGVPAHGLNISAHPQWWHCTFYPPITDIDPNGFFTLPQIVPGKYSLQIHIPKGDSGGISYVVGQMEWPSQDELIRVRVPQKSPGSLVSISGRVIYVGDKKPAYVEIDAYSRTGTNQSVRLQSGQEDFTIGSLEPGTYTLRFSGSNIEEKTITNVQAPSEGLQVELQYVDDDKVKPILQGVVVRADTGQPVTNLKARARKLRTLRGPNYVQPDGWAEFADAQGKFSVATVGPGVYQVQIAAEGFAWLWSEEINTDENRPVTIALRIGGSIAGRVVNEQGQAVAEATVIPLSRAGGMMQSAKDMFVSTDGSVKTDTSGRFVLTNLAAGQESLKVTHEQYCFAVRKGIAVAESQTTEGVDVILSQGGSVEGYVLDAQGKPEPSVTLLFQDDSGYSGSGDEQAGRFAAVVTDANGFYRVDHLPEQMCHIRRSDMGRSLGVVRRCVVPQNGRTLRVDFGGLPVVDGQLVTDGPAAGGLANVRVLLGDVSSPHFGTFQCYAMTDGQGLFRFVGVPAGRYGVYYEMPDKRSQWVKVAVIETTGQNMNIGVVPRQGSLVRIHVKTADPSKTPQPMRVYLQEGTQLWGNTAGDVEPPTGPGEPYVVRHVLPGVYTAIVQVSDRVMIREQIEVPDGQPEVDAAVQIPFGTVTVTGDFKNDVLAGGTLVMVSADRKILAYIYRTDGKAYRVEDLPAGQYSIGYFADGRAPLVTINLAEGQTKTLDIDSARWPAYRIGFLLVQVVAGDGTPLTACQVWLDGQAGRIVPMMSTGEGYLFVASLGKYVLYAAGAGHQQTSMQVEVKQTDLTQGYRQSVRTPVLVRLRKQ